MNSKAKKRTLLIVDDEKSVRDTLALLLEWRGYKVLVAESGAKAIELAAQQVVDGALIDVHMPVMSGVATCEKLRTQAAAMGKSIPVWMMTGAPTSDIRSAAARAGALAVLAKPFDLTDLYRRFDAELGGSTTPEEDG